MAGAGTGICQPARGTVRWLLPGPATQLGQLHSWASRERRPGREEAERALTDDGIIALIVERFDNLIGLWTDDPEDH
jgi:hypothetical protein